MTILWLIIAIVSFYLGIRFIVRYRNDKDQYKLMISIGFFSNITTFSYILLGFHRIEIFNMNLFGVFGWGPTPFIYAIFFIIIIKIFNLQKKIDLLLRIFLLIIFLSFTIHISGLITPSIFPVYMAFLTSTVLIFAAVLIVKQRDLLSVLFLLTLICFTISGLTLGNINNTSIEISEYLPIYSFFISYIFIYIIGVLPEDNVKKEFTSSFFDLKEQLIETEKQRKDYVSRYYALFNSHSDLVYIYDFHGNFLDANQASLKITGYSRDEIKSLNFKDFLDKGQLLKALHLIREIKKHGHQKKPEKFRLRKKDGSILYVEVMSSIIYEDGKPVALQGIARDISERMRYEKSLIKEKRFSDSLLDSLPGVFYLFDEHGHFLRWNKNFERATEYSSDELSQLTPIDLFNVEHKQKVAERIQEVFERGQSFFEADFLTKYKKKTPYYLTGVRLNIDNVPYCVGVGIDLSDLKKTQIELQKTSEQLALLNKNLEDKVAERTAEVTHLLKQKDEFINQLGHDLKTPLGPLINLLPVLEKKFDDTDDKQIIQVLMRSVHRMRGLVNKTLRLAQLNSSSISLNIEQVAVGEEIYAIIESNSFLLNDKHMSIINKVPDDLGLQVDRVWFDELVSNLISNSVKYSRNGGHIIIDAEIQDDNVLFSVQDDGIGMNSDQIQFLFDEFYKVDESRHDLSSSGLGLAISKRIIEMHGGRIWAESEGIGKGSTFYFTLPKVTDS